MLNFSNGQFFDTLESNKDAILLVYNYLILEYAFTGVTINVPTIANTATAQVPSISTNCKIYSNTINSSLQAQVPNISISSKIYCDTINSVLEAIAPKLSTDIIINSININSLVTVNNPSVIINVYVNVIAITNIVTALVPTIIASGIRDNIITTLSIIEMNARINIKERFVSLEVIE